MSSVVSLFEGTYPPDFFDLGCPDTVEELLAWCEQKRRSILKVEAALRAGKFYFGETRTAHVREVSRLCRNLLVGFGATDIPAVPDWPLPSQAVELLSWAMGWCRRQAVQAPRLSDVSSSLESPPDVSPAATPAAVLPPSLDREDELILRALAKGHARLLTQDVIEAESRVSRRTISARMASLLDGRLVARPKGPKRGTTITAKGLALLQDIDRAKVAQ